MASAILGLVLDSSVLVAAERAKRTASDVFQHVRAAVGDVPVIICALMRTVDIQDCRLAFAALAYSITGRPGGSTASRPHS